VSSIRQIAGGPVLGTVFGNNEFGFVCGNIEARLAADIIIFS